MNQNPPDDITVRFCLTFKLAVLALASAVLVVCLPRAVQAIPAEAMGLMAFYLAVSAFFFYLALFAFSFALRIGPDRIAAEAVPNPFLRRFQCRYADISGIEKEIGWSTLAIYRYREAEPFRIPGLEFLDGSPVRLLEQFERRVGREIFLQRITLPLRRLWPWHRGIANFLILSACVWFAVLILEVGGVLSLGPGTLGALTAVFTGAVVAAAITEGLLLRFMNKD